MSFKNIIFGKHLFKKCGWKYNFLNNNKGNNKDSSKKGSSNKGKFPFVFKY